MKLGNVQSLCSGLGITQSELEQAKHESTYNYIEHKSRGSNGKSPRDLCYPPPDSMLCRVQRAIKENILTHIPLLSEIRGYLPGQHNISVAMENCGSIFEGRIDIHKFHPMITDSHVLTALAKHGLSWNWARSIARLATYQSDNNHYRNGRTVPQGAPTSNHIANIVIDTILRRYIKPFADYKNVIFLNYGDDIIFVSHNKNDVVKCVKHAEHAMQKEGFLINEKKRALAEHRGGKRQFIGCSTGRKLPDYPRDKYRAFRKELRSYLNEMRNTKKYKSGMSKRQLNSIRQRIVYVKRLNRIKARRLYDIYYRICAESRRLYYSAICETHETTAA